MAAVSVKTLLLGLGGLVATTRAILIDTRITPVDDQTYDYIIVGGGVSGLVVANRLTENKNGMSQLGR
jgi:ribulose 1,5-bisphosphate synthetase/thiazole synthase